MGQQEMEVSAVSQGYDGYEAEVSIAEEAVESGRKLLGESDSYAVYS